MTDKQASLDDSINVIDEFREFLTDIFRDIDKSKANSKSNKRRSRK